MELSRERDQAQVRRCATSKEAEQYALVLSAMGISSLIAPHDGAYLVLVSHQDAHRADYELDAYDRENKGQGAAPKPSPRKLPGLEVPLIYWAVLLFFFAVARQNAFDMDWARQGAAQAGLMLQGEWWRAVTALTLHLDGAHILGNLVFGTVFLLLLCQATGFGVAWLSAILAGTLGNVINAIAHTPAHTSIGASTALFAAIGLLAALRQAGLKRHSFFSLRNWAPLAGGATLLVFLGFSEGRTDIMAHIWGFAAGLGGGWALSRLPTETFDEQILQWKCAGLAAGIIACAWGLALVT